MKDVKNIERVRKWQQEQKDKGLCIECSNPANGLRCNACNKRRAENRKKNYQEWKEQGLCCQCGKETLNNKNYCEKHYLMKISQSLKGVFGGKNNPSFDNTEYEFEHSEYGKRICTKYELRKQFNLDSKCVAHICTGKRKTHKGWKMIRCVSGTDSQLKQKHSKALPLGESMTYEAQPIAYGVGG